PVLHTIMAHPYLVLRFRLDGIVTVFDAINGLGILDQHHEAVRQVAVADRLVLTKTDLMEGSQIQLRERLRSLNPAAPILDAAANEASASRLLDCGLFDANQKIPDVNRWLADEAYATAHEHAHSHHLHTHDPNRHNDRIRAFAIASDVAIPTAAFDMFLELLRSVHGPNLLRMKGVVKIAETPDTPVVVHGVQHLFHPTAQLPAWPDNDRRTRLVFITCDIDPSVIRGLFDAFLGSIAPDRADRAALTDNPLVPFGGIDR
ncbi:MAG TPA: GTP-binding protein, partial [Xanthobacteraceae bacterium]|nr:GTP-binding protein [Xanthobacteraceae bacterium]